MYEANLEAIKEIKNLQLTCKRNGVISVVQTLSFNIISGTPDDLLMNVKMIGMACKKLVTTVSEYSETVTNEKTRRQLDLERRSINSELKQVVTQMALVKKFNDTKVTSKNYDVKNIYYYL